MSAKARSAELAYIIIHFEVRMKTKQEIILAKETCREKLSNITYTPIRLEKLGHSTLKKMFGV